MRFILTFTPILLFTIASYAQSEPALAAVEWTRYRTIEHQLSAMFPKLPTVREVLDKCEDTRSVSYYAYAEGAVYELTVSGKLPKEMAKRYGCERSVMKFSRATLDGRLGKLGEGVPATRTTLPDNRPLVKFVSDNTTRWVISDRTAGERWIELAVHHYPDAKIDLTRFLESLEFSAADGTDIAAGADTILGDARPAKTSTSPTTQKVYDTTGVGDGGGGELVASPIVPQVTDKTRVIVKQKALYTDEARKKNEQGAVRLKVALLANGSIGSITVVTPLKYGLTEQAIAAARKLVFLPKRVNGIAASAIVTLEYVFSIY